MPSVLASSARKTLHSFVPAAALLILASGCSGGIHFLPAAVGSSSVAPSLTGNWSFVSPTAPATAAQISGIAGALQSVDSNVSGTLHIQAVAAPPANSPAVPSPAASAATPCISFKQAFAVSGTLDDKGALSLTSAEIEGNRITLTGTYDSSSRAITGTTYSISGPCAAKAHPLIATQYLPISGSYNGSFVSDSGATLPVQATLTQTSTADVNGNFTLQGSATFPASACLTSPVVTSSAVSGNNFSATYTDAATGTTVVASGTFNSDATALTIGSYTMSGSCTDSGHGTLTK